MVLEQRLGRVDRIGQTFVVLALNMMLGNSVDKRVYEVIETKLSQILAQLGIDKTADVLDSTLEADQVNRLYLTSLLNPAKFEKESSDWLEEIKKKLLEYKTTEGALPTLNRNDLKAEKVDAIKHSPLPTWLEKLVKSYLQAHAVPYQNLIDGMRFQFPGRKENIYTFNIRESVNNPIPEPVSLQHEIIQTILSEAVPFTSSTRIPLARFSNGNANIGTWSLWHLEARNQFETRHLIQPLFFSDQDDTFPAFAQEIWTKMAQEEDFIESIGLLENDDSKELIDDISEKAEALLLSKYQDLEQKVLTNTERIKYNKERSFEFQERQMQRIGIDNIRLSRLQRLYSEKEKWQQDFQMARQIIPALNCLMIIKFTNG
jgi:hypothetical protein